MEQIQAERIALSAANGDRPDGLGTSAQGATTALSRTGATKAPRRHGPKADMEFYRKAAEVISKFGPSWKEETESVCELLDEAGVAVSNAWKKQTWGSWVDASNETSRENIVKAVEYRLRMASRQTSNSR